MDLTQGWELTGTAPGRCTDPTELTEATWRPAQVPGTVAAVVGADGRDFDAEDWWFRCRFTLDPARVGAPAALVMDGLATTGQVWLNGVLLTEFGSMWQSHELDVSELLKSENELLIACRALVPLLARRRRPAPRWRTRVVNSNNLRWYRTMIFGRSPGFASGPAAVGPWRPVRLLDHRPAERPRATVRTRLDGRDGVVSVRVSALAKPVAGQWNVRLGSERARLADPCPGGLETELRVADVRPWWPHTHGAPVLHELGLEHDGDVVGSWNVGFRSLGWADDIAEDGLDLQINGQPVFVRGAVWTPADLIRMAPTSAELRNLLERVRDAGMNMLRVVGTGAYESPMFHDLCDELGILVWQDLMFANMDYPEEDGFLGAAQDEARHVLRDLAWRPSLAVVCGNSEVEQQPAMMGLDPALGRGRLWDSLLPAVVAESGADCAYIPSTPSGGALPFHADRGVAHYFGVSGYFRMPEDARRANVKFASESLAFANVPDEVEFPVHHPLAKAGVQRDAGTGWDIGAGWDFDDVRDHYLSARYEVNPVQLRRYDHERYLNLSRAVSGQVMAETIGEWRRAGSPCNGALVLWLKDMLAGAGLGILDHRGQPKVAYHHLRRAMAPVAVWLTDEGVNGLAVHLANDPGRPFQGHLRLSLFKDFSQLVEQTSVEVRLAGHEAATHNLEELLGHFVDPAWAYRFGPPSQDVIVASLEHEGHLVSQAFHLPAGPPQGQESADRLGLQAVTSRDDQDGVIVTVATQRFLHGVRVQLAGYRCEDDSFCVEPGVGRRLRARPDSAGGVNGGAELPRGELTALNLAGRVRIGTAA
ncbi:MAG TPA: hypothetical protein VG405_05815 [Solirubrobacteraceae bacterium]|jgi:beta-mannosidase|nr:hypothetical protein [Solirubrobacteraceae bacterium]